MKTRLRHLLGQSAVLPILLVLLMASNGTGQVAVLHHFEGGVDDGRRAWSNNVLEHDGRLYGMTRYGGDYDAGVIYSMNDDGSDYALLHEFGAAGDGREPHNGLTVSGSTLYGMALAGGTYNQGTIFRINLDGSGYQTLFSFTGTEGASPHGDVIPVGDNLYGHTRWGGAYNMGVIFRCGNTGLTYDILHHYAGAPGGGNRGHMGLLYEEGVLYGQTWQGGATNHGTIWSMNADGSDFMLLHSFDSSDGSGPHGYMVRAGEWLVGQAPYGGTYNTGTTYRIHPDGSDFEVIHHYGAFAGDATSPVHEVTLIGSRMVHFTSGALVSMNFDGSDYVVEHNFSGAVSGVTSHVELGPDGYYYGMTGTGGAFGHGTAFKYNPFPAHLDIATLPPDDVELSWDSSDFNEYQLQYSLEPYPEGWSDLGDVIPGTGGTITVVDPIGMDAQKYYRVLFIDP